MKRRAVAAATDEHLQAPELESLPRIVEAGQPFACAPTWVGAVAKAGVILVATVGLLALLVNNDPTVSTAIAQTAPGVASVLLLKAEDPAFTPISRRELAGGTSAPTVTAAPTSTATPSVATATTATTASSLWEAARIGSISSLESFVAAGGDLDARDEEVGSTPMIEAVWHGHEDVVKYLIKHSADIDKKDLTKNSPLHWAAKTGREDILELLLDEDVSLNAKNEKEETPLHMGVHFQQIEAVRLLLKAKGINMNEVNKHGRTPLDMSKDTVKGTRIKELLKRYGAESGSKGRRM
eukprot:gene13989-16534_t